MKGLSLSPSPSLSLSLSLFFLHNVPLQLFTSSDVILVHQFSYSSTHLHTQNKNQYQCTSSSITPSFPHPCTNNCRTVTNQLSIDNNVVSNQQALIICTRKLMTNTNKLLLSRMEFINFFPFFVAVYLEFVFS